MFNYACRLHGISLLLLFVLVVGAPVLTGGQAALGDEGNTADARRPDTYFLQQAAERGLAAIAPRLDETQDYLPFFRLQLRPEPRLLHDMWDRGDMCGRYVDAYLLGRSMTGFSDHVAQEQSLRRLLDECDPYENPFMATRMLIARVSLFLADPSPKNKKAVEDLARVIRSKMTYEGDYAYFIKRPDGWSSMDKPVWVWDQHPSLSLGGCMLALARYLKEVSDPELLDLQARWTRFFLDHSGVVDPQGRYNGLTSAGGIIDSANGSLQYGLLVGDKRIIDRAHKVFDWTLTYCSNYGWVPTGLGRSTTSETCAIVDALHTAILLGRHVDPKYYDFVERCARNQLLENQFLKPELAIPEGDFPEADRVAKTIYGSWSSWAAPNSHDPCIAGYVEGCCLGSGIRGCYLVWNSAIERCDGVVRVHLSLSRNSPWVEVVSYRPYQGRVDVLAHETTDLAIRVPPWVGKKNIRAHIGGKSVVAKLSPEGYLELKDVKKGQWVRLEYPLRQVTLTDV